MRERSLSPSASMGDPTSDSRQFISLQLRQSTAYSCRRTRPERLQDKRLLRVTAKDDEARIPQNGAWRQGGVEMPAFRTAVLWDSNPEERRYSTPNKGWWFGGFSYRMLLLGRSFTQMALSAESLSLA